MRLIRYVLVIYIISVLSACAVEVDKEDVSGRYVAYYYQYADIIEIRTDNTYERYIESQGDVLYYDNGIWEFYYRENSWCQGIEFNDYTVVRPWRVSVIERVDLFRTCVNQELDGSITINIDGEGDYFYQRQDAAP